MPTVDRLIEFLKKSQTRSIQASNAEIEKEFLISKNTLARTYHTHPPEDMPFDIQRVQRDFAINRDLRMVAAAEEIRQATAVTIRLAKLVYEADPEAFEKCARGDSGVVISVRSEWSRDDEAKVMQALRSKGKKGVTFSELAQECGFAPGSSKRRDCKRFISIQRQGPEPTVIVVGGAARSTRYAATFNK